MQRNKTSSRSSTPRIALAARSHLFGLSALLSLLFVAIAMPMLYPATFKWLEGDSLFMLNAEYLGGKLLEPLGISQIIANYLSQFYYSPLAGGLVLALVFGLCLFVGCKLFGKWGISSYKFLLIVFIPFFLLTQFIKVEAATELLFLLLAWWAVESVPVRAKPVLLVALPVLSYPFVSSVAFLLLLAASLLAFVVRNGRSIRGERLLLAISMVLAIALCFVVPAVWSNVFEFVPFNKRTTALLGSADEWRRLLPALYFVAIRIIVPFFPVLARLWPKLAITAAAVAASFVLWSDTHSVDERMYKLSFLADKGDWQAIINDISYEDVRQNRIYACYALLAESNMGRLSETLLNYPVTDPEQFLFRHAKEAFLQNFNRQFYASLGIPDEAFHMAFEYAVQTRQGMCFSSLRNMADYALATGQTRLAAKYIAILYSHPLLGKWVAQRQEQLGGNARRLAKEPLRSDTFTGGYAIDSEMVRLYQFNDNRKAFEYLLCGLLLQKQLSKFAYMLSYAKFYKGRSLPPLYAQAFAILAAGNTEYRTWQWYDADLTKRFMDFAQLYEAGKSLQSYSDTYWYYNAMMQPPTANEQRQY